MYIYSDKRYLQSNFYTNKKLRILYKNRIPENLEMEKLVWFVVWFSYVFQSHNLVWFRFRNCVIFQINLGLNLLGAKVRVHF